MYETIWFRPTPAVLLEAWNWGTGEAEGAYEPADPQILRSRVSSGLPWAKALHTGGLMFAAGGELARGAPQTAPV